jgi:hypothetical protein
MEQPSTNHQTDSPRPDPRPAPGPAADSSILDPRSSTTGKRPNRGWIWFFVILAVLAVAAVAILWAAILWIDNVNPQLTKEQFEAARKLWSKKGPRDYILTITKEGSAQGTYVATIRAGDVESVVEKVPGGKDRPLEKRLYSYYDMTALFDDLQRFLEFKNDPSKGKVFLRAHFAPEDGHIQEYVYSNSTDRQRVRVVVQLTRDLPRRTSP